MPISADTLRGYTDTIILAQLLREDSYGYEIIKEATLYTAFKRLEQNGLITSYWGDEESSARRRYYAITEAGRERWEERAREWKETRALLDALLSLEVGHESD